MLQPQVLIVGAGPTGLVLALWLARLGVRFRLIDRAAGPGETSRAIAVQARTLEFYRQLGIAEDAIASGIKIDAMALRVNDRPVVRLPFGDFGQGQSPYPFVLSFPQDDHERMLIRHLATLGVTVERSTELTGLTQDAAGVRATLQGPRGDETVSAEYVCGCDGARSSTRHLLNIGFPGGTYEQMFFVADTTATGELAQGSLNPCLSRDGFCLVIPVRSSGRVRVIGIVPAEAEKKPTITWEDVAPEVLRATGLKIDAVHWFSAYHVHHRVANQFRRGRVFLSGDAAHIHSPAGGQGMNTGIGDAINLAWKLAARVQGRAGEAVLDTYEPERMAFARTLVSTTDWVFNGVSNRSWLGWLVRGGLIPRVLPLAVRIPAVQRQMFRVVSQTRIHYRHSRLSLGRAGEVAAGDRLPWSPHDNFAPLTSLDWQVHVYGQANAALRAATQRRGLALHEFSASLVDGTGLQRDAIYLLRPDGHIGYAGQPSDVPRLERYLDDFDIVPR